MKKYQKAALPILLTSTFYLVGCQTNKAPDYSGKYVIESANASRAYPVSQSSSPTTPSNTGPVSSNQYQASAEIPDVEPTSNVQVLSQQEAKSILKNRGIQFVGNSIQNDSIPVALQDQKKVMIINVTDAQKTVDANGRDVVIVGSTSKVTLKGKVGKLIVSGERNVVSASSAQRMDVQGNGNHLTLGNLGNGSINGHSNRVDWTRSGPKPPVVLNGKGNEIAKSW